MATERQKKAAELLAKNATLDKPLNAGEIVENSGFGPSMKKNPKVVLESKGVQEALIELGFNPETAKSVVTEIMLNPDAEDRDRLKAASEVFKVTGAYAPEKSISVAIRTDLAPQDEELDRLRLEYVEKLKAKYIGNEPKEPPQPPQTEGEVST